MAWLGRIGKRDNGRKSMVNAGSTHKATVAADPFSFQASHRRLAWMLRLSAGINIVLGAGVALRGDRGGIRAGALGGGGAVPAA